MVVKMAEHADEAPTNSANTGPSLGSGLRGTDGADHLVDEPAFGSVIDGLAGNDVIFAQDGDDLIFGGAGDDVILAGSGADMIVGGAGDDLLYGNAIDTDAEGYVIATSDGTAADTFVFQPGGGTDTIMDFDDGVDVIDLSAISEINSMNDLWVLQHGDDAVIALGPDNGAIVLKNFNADDLSDADFIFMPPPVDSFEDAAL